MISATVSDLKISPNETQLEITSDEPLKNVDITCYTDLFNSETLTVPVEGSDLYITSKVEETSDNIYVIVTDKDSVSLGSVLLFDKELDDNYDSNTNPTTFTITFNPNGGTVSTATSTTNSTTGTLFSLPTPTKTGYTFDGWYDAQTGGSKVTTSTVFTQDTTIYAQFTMNEEEKGGIFTITFDDIYEGDTLYTALTEEDGTLSCLPVMEWSDYIFVGWFDAPTGGNQVFDHTVYTKDTTIYAQWTAIETDTTTEVGIKLNSVEVSENDALVVNYSYKVELTNYGISVATSEEDAINRKGYAQGLGESKIVTGLWVTETYHCTMAFLAYPDPSQILFVAVYGVDTEGKELISSVLTLQREVSSTDYVISFDSAGGSAIPSQTTDTDSTLTSLFTPIRTGYTFNGWYTASSGGTKITTSTVFKQNTTVYAQWTSVTDETTQEAPFTITFSPMGGTVSDSTKDTSTSGKLSNLPTATRENYEFQGWYTLSAGGTEISTSTVFTEDVTVFAQWKRVVDDGEEEAKITDNTSIFSGLGTSSTNGTAVFSKNTPNTSEKVYMNLTLPISHAIDSITIFDESGNLVKFYRDISCDAYYFYQPDSFVTVDITTC